MKNFYLKIWKHLIAFSLAITLSMNLFSVNLIVSGILTPSTAANGRYLPIADLNGHLAWKHESLNYYIYYKVFSGVGYWDIDVDTDDTDVLFYSEDNPSEVSPLNVVSWFPMSGTGSPIVVAEGAPLVPEINLTGNGVSIVDGDVTPTFNDFTNFGSADVASATITRTFIIQNLGTGPLSITGVTITGANASDFTVTTAPASSVASTGTTSFVVTFNPSALGNRNATINIANDDSNENPYNFDIQGYGYTPSNLVVSGITNPAAANGSYIHQGTIAGREYWKHATLGYYLFNGDYSGTRYWNIDVDTDPVNTNYLYYITSDVGSPVGISPWTPNTGITGTPVIANASPTPDINLVGNSVSIVNGDATPSFTDQTNFGSVDVSSGTRTRTFTIQNTGGAALTLSGSSPYVSISGTAASDFTVTTTPSSTIAAYGSTTFVVTFDPSVVGTRSAALSIASNDPYKNPYTFTIQGDGFFPQNLIVSGITSPAAANGNYIYQGTINDYPYWKHATLNYYIYNKLYSGFPAWNIDDNLNDDASQLFYSNNHLDDPSPVNVTSWAGLGSSTATGSGTPILTYSAPIMDVQGNSVSIANGDVTPSLPDYTDFGSVNVTSGTVVRTYTIKNTGNAALTLSGTPKVAVSGTNASEFTVTTQPTSPVAATSGTTTFQVTFDPSGAGIRTATLSIANDDSYHNPYSFSIQGTGMIVATITTQAVSSIAATTATGNGNITNLGVPNPTAYGVCWNTTGTPTTSDSKVDKGAASATGAFTASMTSLTANTTYYVRAFATNTAGTSYGAEVSFTTSPI
ncbi:MAG TPA: choice-of-anchor D domain-containing protein, partial [Williamwhitmania sp.]|nr:choice-of-anchor D domain-containing protein [Williamwhitmania sp.]